MATTTSVSPTRWAAECDLLRCTSCRASLEPAGDDALKCTGCAHRYPIREGLLDMLPELTGNNKVAADFYNGPLWPKFRFWEYFTFFWFGGDRRARMQVMKHLPNLSGTRLLEVAIGDGSNLPMIPEDCAVYGNDVSLVQLQACQKQFPNRPVRLILGEAETLPFADHVFDNVLSFGAYNYFNDPLKSLKEMARVLKPGGLIVLSDEVPDLPNYLIGHWIGWPSLDRWLMSDCMKLSPEFADMVDRHRHLKLEPIMNEVFDSWQFHLLWGRIGYCVVGRPKPLAA